MAPVSMPSPGSAPVAAPPATTTVVTPAEAPEGPEVNLKMPWLQAGSTAGLSKQVSGDLTWAAKVSGKETGTGTCALKTPLSW